MDQWGTADFTCVEQLVYSVAWPYTCNSITESRHAINQLFNASEIRCNVVNCLPICVLLNITSYASTNVLDQASVEAYEVTMIFNSMRMGKQLTTLPH